MSKRVYNFNPGPATLPYPVLEKAAKSVLEFEDQGMSILEMSHRSKQYEKVNSQAEADIKALMGLSEDYRVLFMGGGASLQFAMIPLNLLREGMVADYINTGEWSTRAIKEAQKIGKVNVAASSEDRKFTYIPKTFNFTKGATYVHMTTNNTIYGTQWHTIPEVGDTPLFADMSSDILSQTMDFNKFSLIYAGAQKNLGPAGVTIIILKKSLLEKCSEKIPLLLSYKTHEKNNSLYNTPPVFSVYVVGLVLEWIKEQGGLKKIEEINRKKQELLYHTLDEMSDFYKPNVDKDSRSWMNVTFRLPSEELEVKFADEAKKTGLHGLKGHRSAGGMRASLYNALPLEGVEKLTEFMKTFAKTNAVASHS
ncbi:MAG: 3-phosphoserine/phosphohydroxythreonine transaminase [Candidatus Eremiobacteraeota bacterium]|nr:3-phosphoserine/phosphohydroxythreonine transaminase [Candidatus Eremiobacteraeota bacterium]